MRFLSEAKKYAIKILSRTLIQFTPITSATISIEEGRHQTKKAFQSPEMLPPLPCQLLDLT